jgi:hypothetical protein
MLSMRASRSVRFDAIRVACQIDSVASADGNGNRAFAGARRDALRIVLPAHGAQQAAPRLVIEVRSVVSAARRIHSRLRSSRACNEACGSTPGDICAAFWANSSIRDHEVWLQPRLLVS